jgi:hypothetical protein
MKRTRHAAKSAASFGHNEKAERETPIDRATTPGISDCRAQLLRS